MRKPTFRICFYIVKLEFTGVYICLFQFLFLLSNMNRIDGNYHFLQLKMQGHAFLMIFTANSTHN